ncbi:hypothetical protein I4U23_003667 [Adineta vaga]|nr:hypothetical protein I4U23_003667 [Adineta vaga]
MASASFFLIYYLLSAFDVRRMIISEVCLLVYYAYGIASIQVPFAFVTFTVHRFCLILYYTRPFFRTKKWVLVCIAGQWISEFLISLPFIFRSGHYCLVPLWALIYLCTLVVILPSFINIILNIRIFIYIRSSTQRVQPAYTVTRITNGNNFQQQQQQQQHPLISRREIAFLRQMIFMFIMFIGGWGPTYFMLFISQFISIRLIVRESLVLLCELSLLSLIINLFICNRELRQHLFNKIRFRLIRE